MLKKILFSGLLFKLVLSLEQHASHFRIIPLNFYTLDNRNDKYFSDPNYYGVRIGWIASNPPSENIIINDNEKSTHLNWKIKGSFNPHKYQWGNNLWNYAFIDTKLLVGKNTINIGPWTYHINIPRYGSRTNYDDTTLIIGDANIAPSSRYALGNADIVIKNSLLKLQDKVSLVVWLGDVFYHDTPNSITTEFPKLTNINNNNIYGVPNFLHIGIQGNHDYSSNTACHGCVWNINRDGLTCSNNNQVSGSWLQYFFITDGLKSFNNGLSEIYHKGCRVPYEYSLQIKVLGRTGYIILDNAWKPEEVNIDWSSVSNKLNSHIDNLLVLGHWDYINSGAKSGVSDWISYIYKYFSNKKIQGVQGHTHINNKRIINKFEHHYGKNINYELITAGGNGFRGSGCDCRGNCYNCHCCCPTLYNFSNWIIGGWNNGEFCSLR